jgi:hypothetical protein
MQNYIKNKYPGAECMYPVARAYLNESYEHYFANVRALPMVQDWLNEHHDSLWY